MWGRTGAGAERGGESRESVRCVGLFGFCLCFVTRRAGDEAEEEEEYQDVRMEKQRVHCPVVGLRQTLIKISE
jgi:hypothetical protein